MNATRLTNDRFRVADGIDHTSDFRANRRVRCDCGVDGMKHRTVLTSSYSAPNTDVDLYPDTSKALTANLTSVDMAASSSGTEGSLPLHNHMDNDGEGGNVLKKVFVL